MRSPRIAIAVVGAGLLLGLAALASPGTTFPDNGGDASCRADGPGVAKTTSPTHRSDWSARRHAEQRDLVQAGDAGLLLYGDSLFDRWPDAQLARDLGAWRPLDLGIDGDRTQNLLHRLEPGLLDGLSPAAVVLLIGTNNVTDLDPPCAIHLGVAAVVNRLRHMLPETPILLLSLLPRGPDLAWEADRVAAVNRLNRRLADGDKVHFLDLQDAFRCEPVARCRYFTPDNLHLSDAGYDLLGQRITAALTKIAPTGSRLPHD